MEKGCFLTHPFQRYVNTQNPQTCPKTHPFPGLNLKVGKMNYSLGNLDPNRTKCLKSGQGFSTSGQKKKIHAYILKRKVKVLLTHIDK